MITASEPNTYIPYAQYTLMYKNKHQQSFMCCSFISEASVDVLMQKHRWMLLHKNVWVNYRDYSLSNQDLITLQGRLVYFTVKEYYK